MMSLINGLSLFGNFGSSPHFPTTMTKPFIVANTANHMIAIHNPFQSFIPLHPLFQNENSPDGPSANVNLFFSIGFLDQVLLLAAELLFLSLFSPSPPIKPSFYSSSSSLFQKTSPILFPCLSWYDCNALYSM